MIQKLEIKKIVFISFSLFLVGFQSRFQSEDHPSGDHQLREYQSRFPSKDHPSGEYQPKFQSEDQTEDQAEFHTIIESKITEEANIRTCGIVNSEYNLMEGKLSDTWAQELIGSDLLRAELPPLPPTKDHLISVIDSDVGEHYIKVKNLISDDGPHAVLPELGESISVFKVRDETIRDKNLWSKRNCVWRGRIPTSLTCTLYHTYLAISAQLRDNIPSFINNSMKWNNGFLIYKSFEKLSPPAVLITAGGNNFNTPINNGKTRAAENFHAIVVGSLAPYGLSSAFSQEGPTVHILAPSDHYISSRIENRYSLFGGTSGAAPLVTGTLAGFEWISSYHPSAYEAKILLEKTAIKTLHSYETPQRNGVGLLNSYKIAMLGKRLKEKCSPEAKDPFCFKREIQNDENYYFPIDEFLKPSIAEAFPACAHNLDVLFLDETLRIALAEDLQNTCAEKQAAFLRLRRALFLSPDRRDLWKTLSCIYFRAGFSQNSEALDRLAQASDLRETDLSSLILEFESNFLEDIHRDHSKFAILLISLFSKSGKAEELERLFLHEDTFLRGTMLEGAAFLAQSKDKNLPIDFLIKLLDKLKEDENKDIRIRVAELAGNIGEEKALNLLNPLAKDKNQYVRIRVARAAGMIGGDGGLQLLRKVAEHETEYIVKMEVVLSIRKIGGEESLSLLDLIAQDESTFIREMVAETAGMIGGNGGLNLLKLMVEDESINVRVNIAQAAGIIGGDGGLNLLKLMAEDESISVRVMVARAAYRIGSSDAISLFKSICRQKEFLKRHKELYYIYGVDLMLFTSVKGLCTTVNTLSISPPDL